MKYLFLFECINKKKNKRAENKNERDLIQTPKKTKAQQQFVENIFV